jgi:hypothetical protein
MSKDTVFTLKDWWMRITGVQQSAIWIGATSPDLDLIGDVAYNLYYEAD